MDITSLDVFRSPVKPDDPYLWKSKEILRFETRCTTSASLIPDRPGVE